MVVDSWLDGFQLLERGYGEVPPLVFLFIPDFLISASSHVNTGIVCNLRIFSL